MESKFAHLVQLFQITFHPETNGKKVVPVRPDDPQIVKASCQKNIHGKTKDGIAAQKSPEVTKGERTQPSV